MSYEIKDSGTRQEFSTGACRDIQEGKGRFDLLPSRAMQRLAVHFEKGAKKYGQNNWKLGIPMSRYLDSALRHLFLYMDGNCEEDHLVAALWNVLTALDTESRIREDILPRTLMDIGPYMSRPSYAAVEPHEPHIGPVS